MAGNGIGNAIGIGTGTGTVSGIETATGIEIGKEMLSERGTIIGRITEMEVDLAYALIETGMKEAGLELDPNG